jgi:hypothetical protein
MAFMNNLYLKTPKKEISISEMVGNFYVYQKKKETTITKLQL